MVERVTALNARSASTASPRFMLDRGSPHGASGRVRLSSLLTVAQEDESDGTAVLGLRSFWMQGGEALSAIGALDYSKEERKRLAKA